MSGVSLTPGSPGVERVSRAPGSPRPPVQRRLFGSVDHESLSRELARCRQELESKQRLRWNFDFDNDRPLDGPLVWEVAGPDVPEFYRRGPHPNPGAHRRRPREPQPRAGTEEEPGSQGRKRSGEPMDSSSNNVKKSHRTEAGDTEESSAEPSPEETPKKNKPST
ncbi:cyclin-dependent kinase inhibitor 1B [Pelobates cultripes]|uniref:Cyclin-dependent kinase inhibitor 1B n=1 Tax=Pelobates cultripes TaxID=61616 RepID=A0AAD1RQU5_PELCU|nr:cyclin-dependent kinase inhibitor 1B [Pelobates cultripes]